VTILFFGAGASYGSDISDVRLPPLGYGLFDELLRQDATLWKPADLIFRDRNFEEAWREFAYGHCKNDFVVLRKYQNALASYLFDFYPGPNNLYMKLTEKIIASGRRWVGPTATLNYDILLQRAYLHHGLELNNILTVHGSCNRLANFGETIEGDLSRVKLIGHTIRNVESKVVFEREDFDSLSNQGYVSEMAYYDSDKKSDINDQNLLLFKECFGNIASFARGKIIIVGVSLVEHDAHIWEPLARSKARILYINPSWRDNKRFKEWAKRNSVKYSIYKQTFAEAFDLICQNLGL